MPKHSGMTQSISGPLRNWMRADWQHATAWITDNGRRLTADEIKAEFERLAALGFDSVPYGECKNFDKDGQCLCEETDGHQSVEG